MSLYPFPTIDGVGWKGRELMECCFGQCQ